LLVIALSITGALAFMSLSAPTRADTTTSTTRTLTVSGSGTTTGTPDTYTVSLSVVGVATDTNSAMQKANAVYQALADALTSDGYNASLLTLSSMNVYPEYYYPSNGPAVFQDYRVIFSLQYEETVAGSTPTSLGTKGAGVISDAVKAGVTNVNGVSFSLSDSAASTLKNQALTAATADAKGKAQTLAQGLGVQIVGVQSAQATDSYYPPIYNYAADIKAGAAPTFNAGPATETAQITVVFIIG